MIHWSTALLAFWTLMCVCAMREILKREHQSADAMTAKLVIAVIFIETPWLAYFIYW